jgi:hypothetical protein
MEGEWSGGGDGVGISRDGTRKRTHRVEHNQSHALGSFDRKDGTRRPATEHA